MKALTQTSADFSASFSGSKTSYVKQLSELIVKAIKDDKRTEIELSDFSVEEKRLIQNALDVNKQQLSRVCWQTKQKLIAEALLTENSAVGMLYDQNKQVKSITIKK